MKIIEFPMCYVRFGEGSSWEGARLWFFLDVFPVDVPFFSFIQPATCHHPDREAKDWLLNFILPFQTWTLWRTWAFWQDMDVSENSGTPKIIHFNRVINHLYWGTPFFWKHPYSFNQKGLVNEEVWMVESFVLKNPRSLRLEKKSLWYRFTGENSAENCGTGEGGMKSWLLLLMEEIRLTSWGW